MAANKPLTRFQADLSPKDAEILDSLRSELDIRSNAELLSETLALLSWLVRETRSGHVVASLAGENRVRELVSPLLVRVAPRDLPRVEVEWTPQELANLAKLASGQPLEPNKELVAAMKGR